jgi:Ice-binding-like
MLSTVLGRLGHARIISFGGPKVRLLPVAGILVVVAWLGGNALAAQPPVGLGTAQAFAVLAGSTVTNTGPSTLFGDLGVSPGTAVTGFPPGTVNGTIHAADAVAGQAQSDLTTAYNDAAGRTPPLAVPADLGGLTLTAGVYKSGSSLGLTGTLTLDAQGNPNAVFVFQAASTLITASGSSVKLINGAAMQRVLADRQLRDARNVLGVHGQHPRLHVYLHEQCGGRPRASACSTRRSDADQ